MRYIIYSFLFSWGSLLAQNCPINLSLQLVDPHDSEPLEYATVFLEESSQGAETDSSGMAKISNVCPGNYHLHIDHALCSRKIVYITLHRDTAIIVELEHHEYADFNGR